MIYGIGTDIVEIDRVERALQKSERFVTKYFTEKERELFAERAGRRAQCVAMNFAGKEAVAKALGTGFGQDVRIAQIEILRENSGAPYVVLYGETMKYARSCGVERIHISLSDTSLLAIAYVVAEGGEGNH